jgi:YaaC-like Protein
MFTWSEFPEEDVWSGIKYLKSSTNVKNLLLGTTKSQRSKLSLSFQDIDKRAYEISACIKQGEEYFEAAKTVELTTSPLLLFYGAHSLAKAVILSNNPGTKLTDLNYHGLSTRVSTSNPQFQTEIRTYNENDSNWEVEKEYLITNKGVFPYLCAVVNETVPVDGTVITFKELLRIFPDVSEMYIRHYGEQSHCFYVSVSQFINSKKHEIEFPKQPDMPTSEEIMSVFPELQNDYNFADRGTQFRFWSKQDMDKTKMFGYVQQGTVAGNYFIRPLPCGIYNTFVVMFAQLFILSNIVRYKPSFWMKVIEGNTTGSASMVADICKITKRRFPNEVLNIIWNEEFKYGTPGHFV